MIEERLPDSHGKSVLLLLWRVEEEGVEKRHSRAEHLDLKLSVILEMVE